MRLVRAATKDSSVQASSSRGWYGWSWNVTRSSPTWSARTASSTTVSGCADEGVMKTPNCTGVTMAVPRGVRNEHSQGMKERHTPPAGHSGYVACVTAEALDVLRSWAVQDSPPGAAIAAVVARCPDVPVGWLDAALYDERTVVALYNPRTATAVVPADEAAAFGTAFLPPDDAALKAVVDSALPTDRRGLRRAGPAGRGRDLRRARRRRAQPRRPARAAATAAARASCCRGARAARATTPGAGCW